MIKNVAIDQSEFNLTVYISVGIAHGTFPIVFCLSSTVSSKVTIIA